MRVFRLIGSGVGNAEGKVGYVGWRGFFSGDRYLWIVVMAVLGWFWGVLVIFNFY